MKKAISKLLLVLCVCVCFTSIKAEAKTDKMTLLVGEKETYSYSGIGKIKKITSSNKKVVSVKKKGKYCEIKANKKGKATVTIKGKKGKYKHSITVKEKDFKVNISKIDDYYARITLQNNTTVNFDYFKVHITFKDKNGKPLLKKDSLIYWIGKGQYGDNMVSLEKIGSQVDYSKTEYTVTYERQTDAKYYNLAKKVKFSNKSEKTQDGKIKITLKASTSLKTKQDINIIYDVIGYDAKGNVYSVNWIPQKLNKKNKTCTNEIVLESQAVTYKINTRVIQKK